MAWFVAVALLLHAAALAVARAHGSRVGFVYLPESSEVRSWYPPQVERTARDHFAALVRELDVPAIDAREWVSDKYLADGHHLSRAGAAVGTAFPTNGGRP